MRSYSLKEVKYPRAHLNYEESQSRPKVHSIPIHGIKRLQGFLFLLPGGFWGCHEVGRVALRHSGEWKKESAGFLGTLAGSSLKAESLPPIVRRLPHHPLIPYRRMNPYRRVYPYCQFHALIPFRCRQEQPGCFRSTRVLYRILLVLNSRLARVSTC